MPKLSSKTKIKVSLAICGVYVTEKSQTENTKTAISSQN
jgi:hypothetical protein